jgi:hypothetical protein
MRLPPGIADDISDLSIGKETTPKEGAADFSSLLYD